MKVTQAEFVISAAAPSQFPTDGLPEIALAGRSNVGKSSLINRLIQRKGLARTSSTPGKTQTLNYYLINSSFYFVDFPGYGYAKVSKQRREEWGKVIESYLLERQPLKLVMLMVDLRHAPSANDQAMFEWLGYYQIPMCIVMTKADKVPRSRWYKQEKLIRTTLGEAAQHLPSILFSSETGKGKDELWAMIESKL